MKKQESIPEDMRARLDDLKTQISSSIPEEHQDAIEFRLHPKGRLCITQARSGNILAAVASPEDGQYRVSIWDEHSPDEERLFEGDSASSVVEVLQGPLNEVCTSDAFVRNAGKYKPFGEDLQKSLRRDFRQQLVAVGLIMVLSTVLPSFFNKKSHGHDILTDNKPRGQDVLSADTIPVSPADAIFPEMVEEDDDFSFEDVLGNEETECEDVPITQGFEL